MKLLARLTLINLCCLTTLPAAAEYPYDNQYSQQTSTNTENISKYLRNLGGYLGYDVTQPSSPNYQGITQQLLNLPAAQLAETYIFSTVFGAIPVAVAQMMGGAAFQFLPASAPGAGTINNLANATFKQQNYNSPEASSSTVTVNQAIDQQNFQSDPVSQSILNILATPNSSYCMDSDGNPISQCPYLLQNQVMANIIGPLPNPQEFFSYTYNQPLLKQLNSNVLLAPLFYSTENTTQNTSSSSPEQNNGLTAQNTAQQAANFIRYVSGSVIPPALPSLKDYTALFLKAVPPRGTNVPYIDQQKAQLTLTNYFNGLRVFAAQSSVGMSNLYYILSKRLPQSLTGDGKNTASQAMSEFNMATWRLFNPGTTGNNKQWIEQLNGASAATVQKEIAVLLAEINYQMYLDRQLQERILLTHTVMLMQNTRSSQPSANLGENAEAIQ